MRSCFAGITLVITCLSNPVLGQSESTKPKTKVGNVLIVGNDVTQDWVIRRVIGIYPGQDLRISDLRRAEKKLRKLGIFNIDPDTGIRPTLTVLDSDGEFKDILVQVQETTTGSLSIQAGFTSTGVVLRFVLEEKNFDPFRLPTCMADIWEGRAFRGAGRKIRLTWQVPGLQCGVSR